MRWIKCKDGYVKESVIDRIYLDNSFAPAPQIVFLLSSGVAVVYKTYEKGEEEKANKEVEKLIEGFIDKPDQSFVVLDDWKLP